jgi:hypothetical protein
MTRKLTPQEHLENVIIQQNEGRPVNQYTALLRNPGAKRWERPKSMIHYGGDGDYSGEEMLVLAFIAPVLYFFWLPVVALLGYMTGYLNKDSKVCRLTDKGLGSDWANNQMFSLAFLLGHLLIFGVFVGLATGHPLISMLVPNLMGGIWIIASEFISQRKMFKDIDSRD